MNRVIIYIDGKEVSMDTSATLSSLNWWYKDLVKGAFCNGNYLSLNESLIDQKVENGDHIYLEYKYEKKYVKDHIEHYGTVRSEGLSLENVYWQTEEIKEAAVINDPISIKYIESQPEKYCEMAVRRLPIAIRSIRNASLEIRKLAISLEGTLIEHVLEKYYYGREKCEEALELSLLAVRKDGWALFIIPDPSEKLLIEAVRNNGMVLCDINENDHTEEMCIIAVGQYAWAYSYCKYKTEAVAMAAVNNCGIILGKILNQTFEICEAAYKNRKESIRFIRNPNHYEKLMGGKLESNL